MKYLNLVIIALFIFALNGCATSSYSVGKDFSTESVSKIEKGKTTSSDLLAMFGQPFSKSVISENQEKWLYTYASGIAKAQSYVVTMKAETNGTQKTLDILLKDGVVTNYTFTEGPGLNGSVQ